MIVIFYKWQCYWDVIESALLEQIGIGLETTIQEALKLNSSTVTRPICDLQRVLCYKDN